MPIFRDKIQLLYNIIIRVLGGLAYKGRPMWWRYGYPIDEKDRQSRECFLGFLGPFLKAICAVRDRVAGFLGPFLKAIIII